MGKHGITIGSKVGNQIFNRGMIAVDVSEKKEWGTRTSSETHTIKCFSNEAEYWQWMRAAENKRKTIKAVNKETGEVTTKKIRYMPRYEVVALASYDPAVKFEQMILKDGRWYTTPRKSVDQVVKMGINRIY